MAGQGEVPAVVLVGVEVQVGAAAAQGDEVAVREAAAGADANPHNLIV